MSEEDYIKQLELRIMQYRDGAICYHEMVDAIFSLSNEATGTDDYLLSVERSVGGA